MSTLPQEAPRRDAAQEAVALRQQLDQLIAEAAHNERVLKRMQERELQLLRADSLPTLLRMMIEGLRESYGLDSVSVVLLDPQHEMRHLLMAGGDRPEEFRQVFFVDSLVSLAPQLAALHRPWLGAFTAADHQLLFPGVATLRSIALLPMPRKEHAIGALCFGSNDAQRFTRGHATDFLGHMGAVAAVCLENACNRARLLRAGITDYLTGWHNRRYLQQRMREELARAQRKGMPIACLMIDIDHFKGINDAYGHLVGDAVLKEFAQRIEMQMRSMDTAARYGGDEFAILLPEAPLAAAARLAERIRAAVAAEPFMLTAQVQRNLSTSIGVAAVAPTRDDNDFKSLSDRLLADADAALYRAKALGRNRVQTGTG